MPRRMSSTPFRYPYRVVWTEWRPGDPADGGRRRSKAFVWRGPAQTEVDYLKLTGHADARIVKVT